MALTPADQWLIYVKTNPFYRTLQAALRNPEFMTDGGILGFKCHYSYVFDVHWDDLLAFTESVTRADTLKKLSKLSIQKFICFNVEEQRATLEKLKINAMIAQHILNVIPSAFPRMKGADYAVYESAKLLNIPVHVKPLLSLDDCEYGYALRKFNCDFQVDVFNGYDDSIPDGSTFEDYVATNMFISNVCKYRLDKITWCQKLKKQKGQPCAALMRFGNDLSADIWYKSAAILIGIPKWSGRDAKQDSTLSTKACEDDIIEKCFVNLGIEESRMLTVTATGIYTVISQKTVIVTVAECSNKPICS